MWKQKNQDAVRRARCASREQTGTVESFQKQERRKEILKKEAMFENKFDVKTKNK